MRASAEEGLFPRWLAKARPDGTPVRSLVVLGVMMSIVALLSVQPTLGKQFGILTNAAVVLSLAVYILCVAAVFRFTTKPGARALAGAAVVFSAGAALMSGWSMLAMTAATAVLGAAIYLLGRPRPAVSP